MDNTEFEVETPPTKIETRFTCNGGRTAEYEYSKKKQQDPINGWLQGIREIIESTLDSSKRRRMLEDIAEDIKSFTLNM